MDCGQEYAEVYYGVAIGRNWKNILTHNCHNKSVKPIKNIRRKQLWQTMQTTAAMRTMQAMQTIPARILLTAPRTPAPRIPARMQATQTTAITKYMAA